jgi:hypothetical protein
MAHEVEHHVADVILIVSTCATSPPPCSPPPGASTKEIMSRGGWKSVAMVVRYEHASEGHDAQLAQALNAFTMGHDVVPLTHELSGDRARVERAARVREGEVLDLPPLISENEAESSGGETRTHNLAAAPDEDSEQHQLE